ncbi:hypothetical protein KVP06_04850 [Geobacter sulfurreducens]|uniref:Uncharacterized protein n=1 Tax=Geobacter sulfurreducens (strain ATCC 51573 / DSM 12127 / PCA) TaxID=243231 RepID=Q74EK3_GEOSL|nr:hypothetical protein [Geobacter sulfurreducens]AAR34286.1 hypothetical protein GSU0959 [Geobacter sulfurreducens PCA]AJY70695.1 hypothetical protein RW64_14465 [Geobacter sulfurreducens]UAC05016.1 hypothetical protein KVP06_04850 [Geobacter sulfurreducens]
MQVTDKAYTEHRVFIELERYAEFYEQLAMSVFLFTTMGTKSICNIDTYVYSSMQGTVESIKTILLAGRINDAYALLRKYYDSAVINVYSNLYLRNNFSIENFVVEKIHNWLQGKESLPEFRVMSQYVRTSEALKPINDLLYVDDRYKRLRARCNDHTHYNFYRNVMLNDNEIYIENRGWWLDRFAEDVRDIFVLHLGYIFFLNDHYMMSSDYIDALDCSMQPEEDSQYWVASFIQEIFNEVVTPGRPDITATIKANSAMQLS